MDQNLERLNRIYPNSKFVLIPKYNPDLYKDRAYDSSFDTKSTNTRWKSHPLSYDEAVRFAEEGFRIGWIIPKGFVIIDVDNKDDPNSQEYLEKLLQKFEVQYSYNYTSKGIHILLRDERERIKTDSRVKCALNIEIDTRANETGYIVLPTNDPHREWGRWNDVVEEIPYFLVPLLKDATPSFIGMTEGDGRNTALFKWRTQLEKCHKLSPKEIEKSIRIINENLFDTPMTNQELFKTVLREKDSDKRPDRPVKENKNNILANELIAKYDIISRSDTFYMYNGVYYRELSDLELEKIIHLELDQNLSSSARKEILNFIMIKTQVPFEEFDKDWYKIACKNGVINIVTGELCQPTKSEINTIYIPYNYVMDPPYSKPIDTFMNDVSGGDPLKKEFLYQVAGYCLLKKNYFEKFFIFKGEGGTGKSTFQNLIYKMCGGEANCSHISLDCFDKDYYLSNLVSKLVNLDDDAAINKDLFNTGRLKSIVSGNKVSVRRIYKDVITYIPFVKLLVNCNKLPKIADRTSGLFRKMIIIELNHKVEKPDPLFIIKLTDADMEYFMYNALVAVKTAIEEGHFRINKTSKELIDEFKRNQSPVDEWLYDMQLTMKDIHMKRCAALFHAFESWAENNGYTKKMTIRQFKDEICHMFDVSIEFMSIDNEIKTQVFFKHGEVNLDYKTW